MFTDPQSVTYATVSKSLPAISRGETQSGYKLNDGSATYDLTLSHQFKTRNRVIARLQRTAAVTDPLVPSQNVLASATATFTIDFPNVGLLPADVQNLGKALVGFLTDGTLLKLVNGET